MLLCVKQLGSYLRHSNYFREAHIQKVQSITARGGVVSCVCWQNLVVSLGDAHTSVAIPLDS